MKESMQRFVDCIMLWLSVLNESVVMIRKIKIRYTLVNKSSLWETMLR